MNELNIKLSDLEEIIYNSVKAKLEKDLNETMSILQQREFNAYSKANQEAQMLMQQIPAFVMRTIENYQYSCKCQGCINHKVKQYDYEDED